MTDNDPAVEAAAEAIHLARCCENPSDTASRFYVDHAEAAVAAARPIIEAEIADAMRVEARRFRVAAATPPTKRARKRWRASADALDQYAARIARGEA